ncbi:MAG: stalk domain-containing protein [Defluviitaleaceae bacterium]|nr:stalk domain-containing protein [Defluviitaleaceae bacterium]
MRKKVFSIMFLVFMSLFAFIPTSFAYAGDEIAVTIDGVLANFTDQAPVIVDGRTFVPVRGVFEQLGFSVDWNNDTRQATLANSDYTVVLTAGSETFTTNGTSHTLDVPAPPAPQPTPAPTTEDVRLDINSMGITNERLAEMVTSGEIPANVTWLNLRVNPISDITPLSGLMNLAELQLHENQITDWSPVEHVAYVEGRP